MNPLRYKLFVKNIIHWEENEYEGTIQGIIDNESLELYANTLNDLKWDSIEIGKSYEISLVFIRYDDFQVVDESTTTEFKQINGVNYTITGKIIKIIDEKILLDSKLRILVDLDFPVTDYLNTQVILKPGQTISIRGIFSIRSLSKIDK